MPAISALAVVHSNGVLIRGMKSVTMVGDLMTGDLMTCVL